MKKIVSVCLAAAMLLACAPFAFASVSPHYVVLGDSIAQGFGVYNREEAAYGRIVADTNGYTYANFGVNGLRSWDLIEQLKTPEVAENVARADIISLSIGGNDYLQQNLPKIFAQVSMGEYKIVNDIGESFRGYFAEIVAMLREANPDAALFVQTLYNPRFDALRDFYGLAVSRVNAVITGYLEEHPGAFYLVDTVPVMEGRPEYIAADTVHPSAVGNEALARLVLLRLYEEGFGENTEPVINRRGIDEVPFSSYLLKALRELLERLCAALSSAFAK